MADATDKNQPQTTNVLEQEVFKRLPIWCQTILKLHREIENKTPDEKHKL